MGKAGFRSSDLRRALGVVKEEGLPVHRIEVEGTKFTIFIAGENGVTETTPLDEWLEKRRARTAEGHP